MKSVSLMDGAPLANTRVEEFEGTRPYLATGGASDNGSLTTEDVDYVTKPSRADLQPQVGDVCFARMQGTQKVFVIDETMSNYILSTGFAILRPDPKRVDSGFLRHVVSSAEFQRRKDSLCTGATQRAITNEKMSELERPDLSLAEQKRIAAILDKADAIRRRRYEAHDLLREVRTSLLLDAVGDPFLNPKRWDKRPLKSVLSSERPLTYGILKPGPHDPNGIVMLRIQDIHETGIDESDLHRVSPQLSDQYRRTLLDGGEIVISLVGTIGLVARIPSHLAGSNLHRNLGLVVPGHEIEADYLFEIMVSPVFKSLLKASTTGGIQALLNLGALNSVEIPFPPPSVQKTVVRNARHVRERIAVSAAAIAEAEALFNSLVQQAFRGEL